MQAKLFRIGVLPVLLVLGLVAYRPSAVLPVTSTATVALPAEVSAVTLDRGIPAGLPISFEVNQGQTDPQVQFLAHLNKGLLLLHPTQATVLSHGAQMRMQLVGANPDAALSGYAPLEGTVNYLGKDQSITDISTYAGVVSTDVYPGIKVLYHGDQQHQLEYDFAVAPGADPSAITLGFADATGLTIDSQGTLMLQTASGTLRQNAPHLYQDIGGVRQAVHGSFVQKGDREIGFTVGSYDRAHPLVIDPTLAYSTFLAPGDATAIGVDTAGNTYIAGHDVTEVPYTGNDPGPWQGGTGPADNTFVAKLNAAGSAILYVTYFRATVAPPPGAYYSVQFSDIAVDSAGNAVVTGLASPHFPTTPGSVQPQYRAVSATNNTNYAYPAPVVAKINPSGSQLVYATYLGSGVIPVTSPHIAVDASGNAFIVSSTTDLTFPTTAGAFQPVYNGASENAFLTELGPTGNLVYSTYLGGSTNQNTGNGVAVDSSGGVYVGGSTNSPDFPTTKGAFQRTPTTNARPFVTKFVPGATFPYSGLKVKYSTYVGDAANSSDLAIDKHGNVYLIGKVDDVAGFPTTPGAFRTTRPGGRADIFVAKLNSAGSKLVYSTFLGASDDGRQTEGFMLGIAVDSTGAAWVTGQTDGTDYPTTPNALETWHPLIRYGGQSDPIFGFVTKLHPSGTSLLYSTYLGGVEDLASLPDNEPNGLAIDSQGNVYIAGHTVTLDFPTTPGAFATRNPLEGTEIGQSYGYDAGFVTKFRK